MIYNGIGNGVFNLIAGDEVIFCTGGKNTYVIATGAPASVEAFKSTDDCKVANGVGNCNLPTYEYNTSAVYTSCGANNDVLEALGVVGYKIVKIVALLDTTLTIQSSDEFVGNCWAPAVAGGACCPETNTLLQEVVDGINNIALGDIVVEVDQVEELLQTIIDDNTTCCTATNANLTAQTAILSHIDTDLHTANTSLGDILLELQKQKDFEPLLLTDCDGTLYILHRVYDQSTGAYTVEYTDTTGALYTPTCANPVIVPDIGTVEDCYEVIVPFGTYVVGDKLKRVIFMNTSDQSILATVFLDGAGNIVAPANTDIRPCVEPITIQQEFCKTAITAGTGYAVDDVVSIIITLDITNNQELSRMYFNNTTMSILAPVDYVDANFADCVDYCCANYTARRVCFYDGTVGAQCLTEHTEYLDGGVSRVFYTDNTGTEVIPVGDACTRILLASQIVAINNSTDTNFVANNANTNHIEVQFFKENTQSNLTPILGAFRYGASATKVSGSFETEDSDEISSLILRSNTDATGYAHIYEYFVPKCLSIYSYNN